MPHPRTPRVTCSLLAPTAKVKLLVRLGVASNDWPFFPRCPPIPSSPPHCTASRTFELGEKVQGRRCIQSDPFQVSSNHHDALYQSWNGEPWEGPIRSRLLAHMPELDVVGESKVCDVFRRPQPWERVKQWANGMMYAHGACYGRKLLRAHSPNHANRIPKHSTSGCGV